MTRAIRPLRSRVSSLPAGSIPQATIDSLRVTLTPTLGRLRQPSKRDASPRRSRISGLMSDRSPSPMSAMINRRITPICGAARPIPSRLYMILAISPSKARTDLQTSATGNAVHRRMGSGYSLRGDRVSIRLSFVSSFISLPWSRRFLCLALLQKLMMV